MHIEAYPDYDHNSHNVYYVKLYWDVSILPYDLYLTHLNY